MTRQLTHYRVYLTTWDLYEVWLDAASPEEANAEARRLCNAGRSDEFRHRDCGIEHVEVELYDTEEAA